MIWSCRHGITAPASFGTTNPAAPFGARGACPRTSTCFSSIDSLSEGTMNSDGRSRRRELVEEAYDLQVKAGLMASRIPFVGYYHFPDPDLSHPTPPHPTPLPLFICACNLLVRNHDFTILSLFPPNSFTFTSTRRQRAAQYGAFGLGSAIFAHRTWPTFQSVYAHRFAPPSGLFFCSLRSE